MYAVYGNAAVLVLLHDIQPFVTHDGVRCTSIGIFQNLDRSLGRWSPRRSRTYVHFDSSRFDRFRIVDLLRHANHGRDAVFQTRLEIDVRERSSTRPWTHLDERCQIVVVRTVRDEKTKILVAQFRQCRVVEDLSHGHFVFV